MVASLGDGMIVARATQLTPHRYNNNRLFDKLDFVKKSTSKLKAKLQNVEQ